jgi:hypothetical protein
VSFIIYTPFIIGRVDSEGVLRHETDGRDLGHMDAFFLARSSPHPNKNAHGVVGLMVRSMFRSKHFGKGECTPMFSFIQSLVGADAVFSHIVGLMKPAIIG